MQSQAEHGSTALFPAFSMQTRKRRQRQRRMCRWLEVAQPLALHVIPFSRHRQRQQGGLGVQPVGLVVIAPVQRVAHAGFGQQVKGVGRGSPVLAQPAQRARAGDLLQCCDGRINTTALIVQRHVGVHHARGRFTVRDPLAAPIVEGTHQRRQALRRHGVGSDRRPDAGLAQGVDEAKDAHAQAVLALRPATVVGRKAAKLAHHARVAQGTRRGRQIPVLQEQHDKGAQTAVHGLPALRQGLVVVQRVIHGCALLGPCGFGVHPA